MLAAERRYNSDAEMRSKSSFRALGMPALEYLASSDFSNASALVWNDPTPDIIAGIQEMAFRAGFVTRFGNASDFQTVSGERVFPFTRYSSDLRYQVCALPTSACPTFDEGGGDEMFAGFAARVVVAGRAEKGGLWAGAVGVAVVAEDGGGAEGRRGRAAAEGVVEGSGGHGNSGGDGDGKAGRKQ